MVDEALHIMRVKLTGHDDERAFPVNNTGTRRDSLRHSKLKSQIDAIESLLVDLIFANRNRQPQVANRKSQQVAHLHSLGLEILCIVRIGFAANRHLFDHLNAVTLKTNNFLRVVR